MKIGKLKITKIKQYKLCNGLRYTVAMASRDVMTTSTLDLIISDTTHETKQKQNWLGQCRC